MVTSRSTPNIALIKYWGNRNNDLRLPAADSLSMTLDGPMVEAIVEPSDTFTVSSFHADGTEKKLAGKDRQRFEKHLFLTRQYLKMLDIAEALPASLLIKIRSQIPRGIGIASSAAVFSAVAEAYAALIQPVHALTRREISIIARFGSGSAARGVFGGFVALRANGKCEMGNGKWNDGIDSAYAEQIAPESHWILHDIIVVPSQEEKKVGSTEGHALAHTSPLFKERIAAIPGRMEECIAAIRTRDFEKLQHVAEEDCLNMHDVMRTSTPSLQYLSEDTFRITRGIIDLRAKEHLEVLTTMDAGPTVHLICTEEALPAVQAFTRRQKGCTAIETQVGAGSSNVNGELKIEN